VQFGRNRSLRLAKVDSQRHQPLLGAVVQVAFDAAPCVVGGRDDPGDQLTGPVKGWHISLRSAGNLERTSA
jgi:hypothetical protein